MGRDSYNPDYYRMKENTSNLTFAVEGLTMPEIDVRDITQVMERIKLYLERCDVEFQEPGVAGMCVWLGITTERWNNWLSGAEFPHTHQKACERIMTLFESQIEQQLRQGTINPVTGMFLLKSQFNYVDTPKPKKARKQSVVRDLPLTDILKIAKK